MNPLEMWREEERERLEALAKDKSEAQREAAVLNDLVNHPGWTWLIQRMSRSLRAWEEALDTSMPVGEGAARMARAQGAKIALKQFMLLPGNTAKAIEAYVKGQASSIQVDEEVKDRY